MQILKACFLMTALSVTSVAACAAPANAPLQFDFGSLPAPPGYTKVREEPYTPARGYGFENDAKFQVRDFGNASDHAFEFSVKVPPGNYLVEVSLGGAWAGGEDIGSQTTVKAEGRRLMLPSVGLKEAEIQKRTFVVAVKSPQLANDQRVRLKPAEQSSRDWDDKLTLELGGWYPTLRALSIQRVDNVPTVFLAGDSTVTNQRTEPYAAWGQMLPRFFGPQVAISNEAESGESLCSFVAERRLAHIEQTIKPGDYLFIQFAHNDQKAGANHVEPFTTYQEELMRFAEVAKDHGATPVFVTSMPRRRFDAQGHLVNTLGDYPAAMRQLAQREAIALIDLNASAQTLFETMGPEGTLHAFVHYPANLFPGQTKALQDDTHFNNYGAYELARAVVEGIRTSALPLKALLREDVTPFDPAHPDDLKTFDVPYSLPKIPLELERN